MEHRYTVSTNGFVSWSITSIRMNKDQNDRFFH